MYLSATCLQVGVNHTVAVKPAITHARPGPQELLLQAGQLYLSGSVGEALPLCWEELENPNFIYF